MPVSYTHLRAHETEADLVCRLLLEKKKYTVNQKMYKFDARAAKLVSSSPQNELRGALWVRR